MVFKRLAGLVDRESLAVVLMAMLYEEVEQLAEGEVGRRGAVPQRLEVLARARVIALQFDDNQPTSAVETEDVAPLFGLVETRELPGDDE